MEFIKTEIKYTKENLYACFYKKNFYGTIDIKYHKTSIIIGTILFILYILSFSQVKSSGEYWMTFAMLCLPAILAYREFAIYLYRCFKWKNDVDLYVKNKLSYSKVILTINDKGCGIEYDSENIFRYWNHISKYDVNENGIKIYDRKEDYILIPSSSVDENIRLKIMDVLSKNGEITIQTDESK